MIERILLVDDESHVLSGYKRNLRSHFKIYTADSGREGIEVINKEGPFPVVVCDFKMPEMNGNQFLSKVKSIEPDTVRIMLTGYADIATTIDAVNEGNIFRLLTKPCTSEKLINTINDGIKQYQLVTSEKELLEKTLKGTIKILIDILSTVNPIAFSRVSRFKKFIPQICNLLNIKNRWELEIATLLSQIGLVAMPPDLLQKKYKGEDLSEEQESLYISHPSIGKSLLGNIPRLEQIAEAIQYQFISFTSPENSEVNHKHGTNLPLISRILKVLNDFDTLVTQDYSFEDAIKELKDNESNYDPNIIIALDAAISGIYEDLQLLTQNVEEIDAGVVSATDIKDKHGQVLITKGAEITEALKIKLVNYAKLGHINNKIKVLK